MLLRMSWYKNTKQFQRNLKLVIKIYENPPCHSEYGQPKYLQQTLNSINAFLRSLMKSYGGSCHNLLRVSWYKSIKPFQRNLKLVINIYLYGMHNPFPSVDSSYNFFC